MSDSDKATFEPFITVSLGGMRQAYQTTITTKIAISSNAPGVTAIHWYDAAAARRLVVEINKLIDVLDPPRPDIAEPAICSAKHKPRRAPGVRRKTKKAKR
jgi:hypothetical protein